ncbi:MAG: UPF0262 family protein [Alphaproteobacteria bacterium]|jgi:uncharacterized protein (UPF0262 family)|nr:UPF0262 family protein [Alphaproteobacteria bacterium]MDP7223302.1 UPF0262 family protein [Alphaproteobacteria bacterium]
MKNSPIANITFLQENRSPLLQNECDTAIRDLTTKSDFHLIHQDKPPYNIDLDIQDNRLVMDICNPDSQQRHSFILSMSPYRRLIQDYFMMIESYEHMRLTATPEKLQTVDMARRGVHNEGADLLIDRLNDKIEMDHETARCFFTLICSLGMKRGLIG